MRTIQTENANISPKLRAEISYQAAMNRHRTLRGLGRISWATWVITIVTVGIWCFTASQVALASGAHGFSGILANVWDNAINIQNQNALANVLIQYGAKENTLIAQGQYWRFITPVFLHANLLHVGLNMLNFVVLGIVIERIMGHARFLLVYILTGVVSIIASFAFSPQDISVGASGAIFGLVGAYTIFILMHRRAFRRGGIPSLIWIALVIAVNLCIGLFISDIDNYAHLGGLLSGCLLGWWFAPYYTITLDHTLVDIQSLSRRWPLAIAAVAGTVILAIIALHFVGG
jgi:membrane associated rhomboid family serine protease